MSQIANLFAPALYDALATIVDASGIAVPITFIACVTYWVMQLIRYIILPRDVSLSGHRTTWSSAIANVVQSMIIIIAVLSVAWTGLNRIGWDASYIVSLVAPLASLWLFKDPAGSLVTWIFCVATRIVDIGMVVRLSAAHEPMQVTDISFTGVHLKQLHVGSSPPPEASEDTHENGWHTCVPCVYFMNNMFSYQRMKQ